MMPRYYMKFLGGASKVHTLVGLAPSNHGTSLDGLVNVLHALPSGSQFEIPLCTACSEQTEGSAFLQRLNAGGDTLPGVNYTVIETRDDEVVTPYTSAFLSGPGVTNITLQDQCRIDPIALRDVLVRSIRPMPSNRRAPSCCPCSVADLRPVVTWHLSQGTPPHP